MNKQEKAKHAQLLMNDPLMKDYFERIGESLYRKWLASTEIDERDRLHWYATTLDIIKKQMATDIAAGREEDNA